MNTAKLTDNWSSRRPPWIWRAIGIVWLAAIGWLTLRSAPDQASSVARLRWYCVLCGEAGAADVFLNLLLYAPLGVVTCALGWSWWRTLLCVLPLTIGVETTQGLLLVGRDASLGDVLANSGGALLGWASFPLLLALARPSRRTAGRGLAALLVLTTLIWIGTAAGLRSSFSNLPVAIADRETGAPGRWSPPLITTAVELNGVVLPDLPRSVPVPRSPDRFDVTVEFVRTAVALARHAPPFARIDAADSESQVKLSASGNDLVVEAALRAGRWLLHTPEWRFDGALDVPPGIPRHLMVRWTPDGVSAQVGDGRTAPASRPRSIALGWIFIHPFTSTVDDSAVVWSCLWLAWWFGLAGWLGGAVGWPAAAIAGGVQLLAMVVIAALTATPWHVNELLVAAAACGAAAAWSRRAVQRRASGSGRPPPAS